MGHKNRRMGGKEKGGEIFSAVGGLSGGEEKRKVAGKGDSLNWVKERKTSSSWEDSLKKKKFGEQNRGRGREREELGKRG